MVASSIQPVTGEFTGTGVSFNFQGREGFSISLSGLTDATVELQRSFDGVAFLVVEPFTSNAEKRVDEPNIGVIYRFECTIYGSGTIAYRLS